MTLFLQERVQRFVLTTRWWKQFSLLSPSRCRKLKGYRYKQFYSEQILCPTGTGMICGHGLISYPCCLSVLFAIFRPLKSRKWYITTQFMPQTETDEGLHFMLHFVCHHLLATSTGIWILHKQTDRCSPVSWRFIPAHLTHMLQAEVRCPVVPPVWDINSLKCSRDIRVCSSNSLYSLIFPFEVAVDLTLLSVPDIITDLIKEWIVIYARTPATMVEQ